MSSTHKTSHLNLNQWTATDKPTRADFVSDNTIIDSLLGGHIDNMNLHLTANEKTRVSSPYFIKLYQGTGDSLRTITLDFSPQLVICFALDKSPVELTSNVATINWGIAVNNYGGSGGCELSDSTVAVTQNTEDGIVYNLNKSGGQYLIVAFR